MRMKIENLHFSYGSREVLKGVSFGIDDSGFVSVLGPNGAGKSTLFRCMLGLLEPSEGSVHICGRNIRQMPPAELSHRVAYIPQSHTPVFNFSVFDMVLMGTTAQLSRFSSPGKKEAQLAEAAMERIGISHLRSRGCGNISGGELQLALIARAIAQQAKILVMDEPSASLDYGNKLRLMETVKGLTREGYTVIQSTHDPDQAYLYSDQILALYDGKLLARGTPQETISSSLISRLYGVDVEVCSMHRDDVRVCIPAHLTKGGSL